MTSFGQLASGRINRDATIQIGERWHRRESGEVVYERRIGDGPWETMTEMLERNVFELGHSDNTIEVSGAGWNWDHTLLDIEILCGHCHKVTSSVGVNGHFCCRWAGAMYERHFQFNWMDKR